MAVDEAFLVYDAKKGKKHWSYVGKRVMQLYTGSYKRVVPHCAFAEDGRRLTCFFARANSYTFIEFLRQITAKFGRVAVIAGQYSRTSPTWSRSSSGRTGMTARKGHSDGALPGRLPVPQRGRAVLEPAR